MPLVNYPLGEGVTIASVRNHGECVEESLYLKTINACAPLNMAGAEASAVDPEVCEYRLSTAAPVHPGEFAQGLGFAHLFDGLGVSLASHAYWMERSIKLELTTLDAAGEVMTAQVAARNADNPAAITHHANELSALLAPAIARGAELWERRAVLLPNLVFIPRTRAQLEDILPGDPMLKQVWIKLSGIDKAIAAWKIAKSRYPMFPFYVRPESTSRRPLVEFEDAEGYKRTFSDHCDLAPTEGRIHFLVQTTPERHALIGHVGRKIGIG